MKSSFEENDPEVLKEFLYELICEARRPQEIELLVEAVMSIQHSARAAPSRLAEEIPIGRPAA